MPDFAQNPIPTTPNDDACLDLVNSRFADHLGSGNKTDRLELPAWRLWFLSRYELVPDRLSGAPLNHLVELRSNLRAVLESWASKRALDLKSARILDAWTCRAPVRQRVERTNEHVMLIVEPLKRDWTWVMTAIACSAAALIAQGDPARLKTCSNPDCSWMYYDSSLNGSKQFCSTNPCGTLIRVRRHRQHR